MDIAITLGEDEVSPPAQEIDLNLAGTPPAPPAAAAAAFSRAETPSTVPIAPAAAIPSPPPAAAAAAPPPVRLMALPLAEAGGPSAAPVEVWASAQATPALRGQVATFVGQNAAFAPKSFGELLQASLELGQETS